MTYLLESALVDDCRRAATAMGVVLEVIGQRKAKGSGTDVGVVDALLHAGGKTLGLEFKRPKGTDTRRGRCSLEQIAAAERRRACGVETYLVDDLTAFVRLTNWARLGHGPVCPSVDTVPAP